jgi:integrase
MLNKLKPQTVASAVAKGQQGTWADGGKLFLRILPNRSANWVFRYRHGGKERLMSLGPATVVTLAQAREEAAKLRIAIHGGRDPIEERDAERSTVVHKGVTFEQCCDRYLIAQGEPPRWRQTLRDYCAPIAPMPVHAIATDDVLKVLRPLWTGSCETGRRLQSRIKRVLDYAEAEGMRSGVNPAAWSERLAHYLAAPGKARTANVEHHRDVPWQEMPMFWKRLSEIDTIGARALQILVLTACRAGDLLGQKERADPKLPAKWSDIDFDMGIWSIARPKVSERGDPPWRVPLSGAALAVLRELRAARPHTTLVAESERTPGSPVNIKRLREALRQVAPDADVHGMRASFKSWSGANRLDRETAEGCLNHKLLGDRTELAYKRDQLVELRREMLEAWASHLNGPPAFTVAREEAPVRAA